MLFDDKPMIEIMGCRRIVNYLWNDTRLIGDLWYTEKAEQPHFVRSFGVVNFWWHEWDSHQPNETLRKAALEYLEVIDSGGFSLLRKRA
jgi:hypothetical protein